MSPRSILQRLMRKVDKSKLAASSTAPSPSPGNSIKAPSTTRANQTPTPAKPPPLPSPDAWLEASAYPHVLELVLRFASDDVLLTFRRTSRTWCRVVNAILSSHLVLDGELYSDFPRRSSSTILHDGGVRLPYFFDQETYCIYTSDEEVPFLAPPHLAEALKHTRVLDIRGTVRLVVLDAVIPFLQLDTLRLYAYDDPLYAGMGYSSGRPTAFWTQVWVDHKRLGRRRSPIQVPERKPSLPSVKRLVVFSSLARPNEYAEVVHLLPHPTGAAELVLRLAYDNRPPLQIDLSHESLLVPNGLKRAVIIFTPLQPPQRTEVDITDTPRPPEGWKNTVAELAALTEHLSVPATVVGFEGLASALGMDESDALMAKTMLRVTFFTAEQYSKDVGPETWALCTRESGGNRTLEKAGNMGWDDEGRGWLRGCPTAS